jgi:prepilin-type N-terminal cleavage/methylation domain-containing protein
MKRNAQSGFTLIETMLSLAVLAAVSAIVMSGISQLVWTQGSVANRSAMHTSVRSATELLQQEIGQAGRVSLAGPNTFVTLAATVNAGAGQSFTLSPNTAVVYPGEQLVFDSGNTIVAGVPVSNQETVTVTGTEASPTATFTLNHAANVPVAVLGGFASGIVPPTTAPANYANGSTGTVLKLYGDINGDGNMVYIEYTCDTNAGFLYRNTMAFDAAAKPAKDSTMILLANLLPNPNDNNGNPVPCFSYLPQQPAGTDWYVLDVAVTLTEQTQDKDPQTQQFQKETKALLNVSPRNIYYTWELAGFGLTNRVQPMPQSVTNLLP